MIIYSEHGKAIGATRRAVFGQLMGENLLLVLIGAGIGIALMLPVASGIQHLAVGGALGERVTLLADLDGWVLAGQVLPLVLVFAFLSGGLPAYLIAKRNIAETLKGGDKQ